MRIEKLTHKGPGRDEALERLSSPNYLESPFAGHLWRPLNTTDVTMIKRFGLILGRSAQLESPHAPQDAGAFIRDLSRLTEREVEAANILDAAHKGIWPDPDANRYTERFSALMESVQKADI